MLTNDSNVYVVMSGNFTPAQRKIVKSQCMIMFQILKRFFKEFDDCPSPIFGGRQKFIG
jgi:hypothetical protein